MINQRAEQLGEYIKKLRKDKKVTAKELAGYVGYSQSYISAIENNNNNNVPSKRVLTRLAEALKYIGYDYKETLNTLYEICGYPDVFDSWDKTLINELNKLQGMHDNLTNETLNKPYLNLEYLLTSKLDLVFNYKKNEYDHNVFLTDKQKKFINTMITEMLYLNGVEDKIDEEINITLEENEKINNEMLADITISEKISKLRKHLEILNNLKKNFSEEKFKYEYNTNLYLLNYDGIDKIKFDKKTLQEAINTVTSEIQKLTKEYDDHYKED
ncbi:helix-turn-helix domain-containing protein [Macrococcoides caseolyticum]|uniref:helix-turn-helix domain-containing protein n=1 Tax=Macrococcoides caseolyticum TaxID=69966 RepID=UPI0011A83A5F|nr:helix-turn-helix transcriptional regulator [Macrococcus caseolyticus]